MAETEVKFRKLVATLKSEILGGKYVAEKPLPSIRALMRRSGLSTSTVRHVFEELERGGFVTRVRGAGTFVSKSASSRKIGLLVPGVAYSEFFQPIVNEIARRAQANDYVLIYGTTTSRDPKVHGVQVKRFAKSLVKECVSGVIYQPIEFTSRSEKLNQEILSIFKAAKIAVVLLVHDVGRPADDGLHDVVGINNRRAGGRLAEHLITRGARKIDFLLLPNSSISHRDRMGGVESVCRSAGCRFRVLESAPDDERKIRAHLRGRKPDAFICASDTFAAVLMKTLGKIGLRVPADIMIAGFDDVQLASLTNPPLTTIHQPCREIGAKAFECVLARIPDPNGPAQEISLSAPLVVRGSTTK